MYALMGGAVVMGYQIIIDYMRHHEEANPRPAYMDHTFSTTVVTTAAAAFYVTRPIHLFNTMLFSTVLLAPISWWFLKFGVRGLGQDRSPPNIFYQNDCTEEEIERFRQQDALEEAAANMKTMTGYGYAQRSDPAFF